MLHQNFTDVQHVKTIGFENKSDKEIWNFAIGCSGWEGDWRMILNGINLF